MKRLKVGVVELLAHSVKTPWVRRAVIAPSTSSVMPAAIAAWAESMGHQVHYAAWVGDEKLLELVPAELDVLFVSSFTRSAFAAYLLSQQARARGTVTVLGGPHAVAFAPHTVRHFDFVCQQTDRTLIEDLLRAPEQHRPGVVLSAANGPKVLPTVRERARFIEQVLKLGTRKLQVVPMAGSIGCPYTCSFCVDASVPWRGYETQPLVEDLREIERRWGPDTMVGWLDPNFAVRFDEYLGAIESSQTKLIHAASISLSLLGEQNARRLGRARFGLIGPGVESWFDFSDKSGRAALVGADKVKHVAQTLRVLTEHIEMVQTNLITGLDTDAGELPWALNAALVDQAPGIYPTFFLLTNFYNAPLSRVLHDSGRTLATPFPLLDTNSHGNVRPLHYAPEEYFERLAAAYAHAFSWPRVAKRTRAGKSSWGKAATLLRGFEEGRGFAVAHAATRRALDTDRELRGFWHGTRRAPPGVYMREVLEGLSPWRELLPRELTDAGAWAESFDDAAAIAVRTLREPVAGTVPMRVAG